MSLNFWIFFLLRHLCLVSLILCLPRPSLFRKYKIWQVMQVLISSTFYAHILYKKITSQNASRIKTFVRKKMCVKCWWNWLQVNEKKLLRNYSNARTILFISHSRRKRERHTKWKEVSKIKEKNLKKKKTIEDLNIL
jgi:hypothetical protein